MDESLHWEELMTVPSPTVQLTSMVLGPISQLGPITVFPRRMVPGNSSVPAPTVTVDST